MPEFTPQDFVSKWKRVTSREKRTYTHGWESGLSDEEILEKLLSLNLERGKDGK